MPSSVKVPSSIRRASRSRAVSLSSACWRSIFSWPPPSIAFSRRSCRSSTSERSGGRATSSPAPARGGSVCDTGASLHRVEQRGERVHRARRRVLALERILRGVERGHLHADHLALAGDRLEQVVDLVLGEPV